MEVSPIYESNGHAVPSPNGQYIASQTANHLYIQYANSLETAFTFPLTTSPSSSSTSISSTATRSNVVATIQWSHTSTHVLLITSQNISLFSLSDHDRKVRISNGSGGLGRIVAAEMMGLGQGLEQVIVVWEFGRVAVWDVQSGRAAEELGEVKLASGKLSSGWSIRRVEGKTEGEMAFRPGYKNLANAFVTETAVRGKRANAEIVLALLGRQAAQDTLTLFLPPSTTPFKTIILPTIDAVSITWSENWLAVLDSPLASPASTVYIYTLDGHLFRGYPAPPPQPTTESDTTADAQKEEEEPLGPRSLTFSPNQSHLAITSSMSSQITLLSTRTFTTLCTLDPRTTHPDFCHQEVLTAKSKGGIGRKYQLLAPNAIPYPPSGIESLGPVLELKWSHQGNWLCVRYENQPSAIFIWQIPSQPRSLTTNARVEIATPIMLLQHAPIKKLTWHPLRPSLLLIETEDDSRAKGTAEGSQGQGIHIFDAAIDAAPLFIAHAFTSLVPTETGRVDTRWTSSDSISLLASGVDGESREKLRLLVSSRRKGWFMIFPEGRERDVEEAYPETSMNAEVTPRAEQEGFGVGGGGGETTAVSDVGETGTQESKDEEGGDGDEEEEEEEEGDITQDSLYDILTGRTPLPALAPTHASPSHHSSEETTMTMTMTTTMAGLGLDDTFRERRERGRRENQDQDQEENQEEIESFRLKGLDGSFDVNDIEDRIF
ncbi:hypothetical protein BDV97DRAFT_373415 [Delphinella strobiligena]|nr:hypothetical protein BDV97DRAFT_373415 [Delphinella strobiligena]